MKRISLLGATGSIGKSTLEVVREHSDKFCITAIAGGNNAEALAATANEFHPKIVAIYNTDKVEELKTLVNYDCEILAGSEGVCACAEFSEADICVSAIVGSAGLKPTLAAIDSGKDIALANKEVLVAAGELVTKRARDKGVKILPVDSEHNALFQCLCSGKPDEVRRLMLTGSGGPFIGKGAEFLKNVTPEQALKHPNWDMGRKISIDSATLANKALEAIEAHWLFNIGMKNIQVVIHPQSLVHSMVEYCDGTLMAQIAQPDMRLPILYALSYPERLPLNLPSPTLEQLSSMSFQEPDTEAFPMLQIGIDAGMRGGLAPAVYSAANEEAVNLFLDQRIGFMDIPTIVIDAVSEFGTGDASSLSSIIEAEQHAREHVLRRY